MPIYNEVRFLEEALNCFVIQDYPNVRLFISDNASTDGTDRIAKKYANKYEWISYNRFDKNIGASKNFEYVLEQAEGEYFMWAAGHDLWSRNYLSTCIKMLEDKPKAVIAFGSSDWIDAEGQPFGREYGWSDTRGMGCIERFSTIFWGNMHPFLGVMRTDLIRACPIVNTVGADLLILTQLVLMGDFLHSIEAKWSRREFRAEQTYDEKLTRYKSKAQGLSLSYFSRLFPLFRLPFELLRVVITSRCSILEKVLLVCLLIPSFPIRYLAGKQKNQ